LPPPFKSSKMIELAIGFLTNYTQKSYFPHGF